MGKTYSKDPNVDHQSDSLRLTAFENYQMRLTKQFRYAKFPSSPGNTILQYRLIICVISLFIKVFLSNPAQKRPSLCFEGLR